MGVPALFRWLSKKYPKIVERVIEDEPPCIQDADGNDVFLPVDISLPNPNGFEVDNLYLDMNGIVHPCTHPEGKPPPETEEDMMLEIFAYTERVVNMARPRKLLFLAIDGVAPRAKMNQQRSRRFRAVQEAREKDQEREAGIAMFEAMGKTVSEETKNKKSWDSNAITPGTPFMDLLASSLRYWVVQKLNSDPAWKAMQVIISDASVPGEGEHKIMDYIRRQRVNKGHDPSTQHVIYGLDADLIMLALATHEPNFRVLREDVFAQESRGCRICGEEGHYANQCTRKIVDAKDNTSAIKPEKPVEKKPFIFLDVSVLREYLEIELDQPHTPFPFNLEQALDDWVFLIFFVGNDFLPHLPSLEIREGAIDTLLRIWKYELPRMGGYLTNHGHVVMERAQIILEGLARREDDIFRKRRETEERQDQNAKRRKIENNHRLSLSVGSTAMPVQGTSYVPYPPSAPLSAPPSESPMHHSLPARPAFDIFTGPVEEIPSTGSFDLAEGAKALGGSNADVVNNRRAIRMANMSAAEHLKAELGGLVPLGRNAAKRASLENTKPTSFPDESNIGETHLPRTLNVSLSPQLPDNTALPQGQEVGRASPEILNDAPRGHKRKIDDVDEVDPVPIDDSLEPDISDDVDEEQADVSSIARVVNPDGTVDQADTVRLWEPGYKERYYKQKFAVELSDTQFRREITKSYLEGLSWVLHYYYQGTPSWQWYYPYHFAPFASDFEDVANVEIQFTLGAPFKPFEQLMGVFPAASRTHLPEPFQRLMVDEDSPILDFYPETFEIDMNGKKMAWQGVALLPFIDPKRLLDAMATRYPELNEDEVRRNRWGNNVILTADADPLYDYFCGLYTKKRSMQPVAIDTNLSRGLSGSVLADPSCVPGSTYLSPFITRDLSDIHNDRSISALYFYPKQLYPHRSQLLPGVRRNRPTLTAQDQESIRRGGNRGRSGGGGDGAYNPGGPYGGGRDGVYGISGYSNGNGSSYYGGGRSSMPAAVYPSPRAGYGGPSSSAAHYGGRGEGVAYGGYGASYPPATYGGYGAASHHTSAAYGQRGIPNRGGYGNGGYNTDRSFSYRGASRGRGR